MDRQNKSGKVIKVEIPENVSNAFRVVVNTASNTDLNTLGDNITDFILANKVQTEFNILVNMPSGVTIEKLSKALIGKTLDIVVITATISELSNGKCNRVKYVRSDGTERTTNSISRTYVLGQGGIDNAFEVLHDELKSRLNDGSFEPADDEPTAKESATTTATKAKANWNF